MADEYAPTSSIVARHGIAWMGGGSGSEVFGCACGNRATGTEGEPFAAAHFRHVAELVEQAALAPIHAALAGHPVCDVRPDDDPVSCGWKRAGADVRAAVGAGGAK